MFYQQIGYQVNSRVVSELMRHSSIQTTMGYTFVSDDRRLKAINRLHT